MIYHYNVVQGSDFWHELRSIRFTASNFPKLFLKESTKGYQNLINEVVFSRLTGEVSEGYENEYMRRGKELEPEAIDAYELLTFNKIKTIGFIEVSEWIGCSPDGLIGEDGMIQIKCPKATTLMDYYGSNVSEDYYRQIQGELFVAQRDWSDLFIYHPKLKPIIKRIEKNEETFNDINERLQKAIVEAKKRLQKFG